MHAERRACPRCRSTNWSALLHVTARDVFAQNWSYRPEALAPIAAIADEPQPIAQCAACSFVFAPQLPSAELLTHIYERAIDPAKAREQNLSPANIAAKMRWLSPLLWLAGAQASQLRVLDYGCGFGPVLEILRGVSSVQALGFETSPARLHDLALRGLDATGDRDAVRARAPFHAAVLDNVLEHLADPLETAAFVRSVCAPGAVVFVGVPDRSADSLRRIAREGVAPPMDVNPWEHLNYFSLEHLDALMADAGFTALQAAEVGAPVDVGLRPEANRVARAKNAAASALRAFGYAASGDVRGNVNARFYRAT